MTERAIGIDLGGTNARAALVDSKGILLKVLKARLAEASPGAVTELIATQVEELRSAAGARLPVGLGMAAQILGGSGLVSVAPNLGWRDVPFGTMLQSRLGQSVSIMNDLGAAAWGEAAAGAGAGSREVILVFVGSGVGSGLVLDGRLHVGAMGVAGELGHVKVVPGGRRCGCGELGCLEAYVSGKNLAARVRERVTGGAQSLLTAASSATDIEQASLQGDALAQELWEEASQLLSWAIGNVCTLLNPRKLILGGGVLVGCPALKERVKRGVFDYALAVSRVNLEVVDARLGDDAGVVGAALHALQPRAPTVAA